jgi:hypothetical protein
MPLEPARENLLSRLRLLIKRPHLSAVSFLKSVAVIDSMHRYAFLHSAASSTAEKRDYEDRKNACQIALPAPRDGHANPLI